MHGSPFCALQYLITQQAGNVLWRFYVIAKFEHIWFEHTGVFVDFLTDPSYSVHSAAVDAHGNLEQAALALHAGSISHHVLD